MRKQHKHNWMTICNQIMIVFAMILLFIMQSSKQIKAADIKQECQAQGYQYCSSQAEAEMIASDYVNRVFWNDTKGIKLCYKGGESGMIQGFATDNTSVYFSRDYKSFPYLTEINGKPFSVDGYYCYEIKRRAIEAHSESMTEAKYNAAVNKANQIASQNNYGSTYDKVKRVYQYLTQNVAFDYTYTKGNAYDALIGGSSVCEGYAEGFQLIMEAMGVTSYLCAGYINGGAHAWNIVNVNGQNYYVDVTFGATSTLYDKYLLFGTNYRENIFPIGIASKSYISTKENVNVDVYYRNGQLVVVNQDTGAELGERELAAEKEYLEQLMREATGDDDSAGGGNGATGDGAGNNAGDNGNDGNKTAENESSTADATKASESAAEKESAIEATLISASVNEKTSAADEANSINPEKSNARNIIVILVITGLVIAAGIAAVVINRKRKKTSEKAKSNRF